MEEDLNRQLVETRARAPASSLADLSMQERTELDARSLAEALDDLEGGDHVIPLSGGLDSRAVAQAPAAPKARPLRRGLRRRGFSPPFPLHNYIDSPPG